MLDAFKIKREAVVHERNELEMLIDTARAERAALDRTISSLRTRSVNLTPIGRSLDHITDTVTGVTMKLEEIGERLAALDGRTIELEQLDGHIQRLKEAAEQAAQSVQQACSPNGPLDTHRKAVEQLSSESRHTRASLDGLRTERAALDTLRDQLRTTQTEIKRSIDHAGGLEGKLETIRGVASSLTEECGRASETARVAREDATAAVTATRDVETKLGPLAQLQELGHNTDERLAALNALAERVSLKAKVIENQQHTVEHALVQTNRVNEMVWAMDLQIGRLNEGMKQAAAAEEAMGRLETLSTDATKRLEDAGKLHDDTERQVAHLEERGAQLLEAMHIQVETLAIDKKEIEAVNERLSALDSAVTRSEARISAFTDQERALATVVQQVKATSKRFEELFAQSDELTNRQLTLEGAYDSLAQVEELSRKTSSQMDWLGQARQDLDVLRNDVLAFRESHAQIAQLSAKLATERHALQAFGDQMTEVSSRAPELEAKVNAILSTMAHVESASHKAARLEELLTGWDGQVARVESSVSMVENIESRLNELNRLSTAIDHRLEQQMERRNDFDKLKAASDGVAAQIADAQHKLAVLNALPTRLGPLVEQVRTLEIDIDSTRSRLEEMKPDGAAVADYERRFAGLMATSRTLGTELAERTNQVQSLAEDLARSDNLKDVLMTELDVVHSRQRTTVDQIGACEDQLARAERMFKQLEERRVQITSGEKKLLALEARLADIRQVSDELERSHQAIASREQLVSAVKAEVEAVHLISSRSKADLEHVMQHRGEVAALKLQIERLASRIADTDRRVVSIDARRKLLDEVQNKANVIMGLLADVRINVETIEEQKAVVDQVAQTAAQLEFRLQEARTILGTLQHECEMAGRLEQGIRQLSLKVARPDDVKTA